MVGRTHIEVYEFKKGDITHLDSIYSIQGVGDREWWYPIDDKDKRNEEIMSDRIKISRDIKITITTET